MVSNEPHQVGEVGGRRPVAYKLQHGLVIDTVDVEGERPHGNPHHGLWVVEELDSLGVEREVVGVLWGE